MICLIFLFISKKSNLVLSPPKACQNESIFSLLYTGLNLHALSWVWKDGCFDFLTWSLILLLQRFFFFFLAIWSLVIFDLSWIFLSDSLLIHSAVFSLGKVFLHLILRIEHNTPCLVTLEIGLNSFLELLLFSNIELCLVLIMHVDIFFHFSWTIYLLTWSFEMVLILILFCLHVKFGWVQLVLFLSPLFVGLKPNKFLIQPQRQVQFGLSVQQYEECIHV